MTKKMAIGIIGAGNIAVTAHLPVLSCLDNASVTYVADIVDTAFAMNKCTPFIKIKDDLSVLPYCDVVLLATPAVARHKYIEEFSRRKTPIFSEKPFALSVETHRQYLSWNKKVTCNYMRRCFSSTEQLRQIVLSQVFGKLKQVDITEGGIVRKTAKGKGHYADKSSFPDGYILTKAGFHTMSQLTSILSKYMLTVNDAHVSFQEDLDVDVEADLVAKNKNERVPITYKTSLVRPYQNCSVFTFETATISLHHADPQAQILVRSEKGNTSFCIDHDKRFATSLYQAFYLRWKNFIQQLQSGEAIDAEFETALDATRVIEEIYNQ